MEQYFEVGEDVILESKLNPHLNGECVVTEVSTKPSTCASTGERFECRPHYKLTVDNPLASWWSQSALRKKHEGGDSFESLMASLNKEKTNEH